MTAKTTISGARPKPRRVTRPRLESRSRNSDRLKLSRREKTWKRERLNWLPRRKKRGNRRRSRGSGSPSSWSRLEARKRPLLLPSRSTTMKRRLKAEKKNYRARVKSTANRRMKRSMMMKLFSKTKVLS